MVLTVIGLIVLAASLAGAVALVAALMWSSGGRLLRIVGIVLIASNAYRLLLAIIVPWVLGSAMLWLALGVLLWLLGHWIHLRRFGHPRSSLAQRVFAFPGFRATVPPSARP